VRERERERWISLGISANSLTGKQNHCHRVAHENIHVIQSDVFIVIRCPLLGFTVGYLLGCSFVFELSSG
jgi:hypothetical protein